MQQKIDPEICDKCKGTTRGLRGQIAPSIWCDDDGLIHVLCRKCQTSRIIAALTDQPLAPITGDEG